MRGISSQPGILVFFCSNPCVRVFLMVNVWCLVCECKNAATYQFTRISLVLRSCYALYQPRPQTPHLDASLESMMDMT